MKSLCSLAQRQRITLVNMALLMYLRRFWRSVRTNTSLRSVTRCVCVFVFGMGVHSPAARHACWTGAFLFSVSVTSRAGTDLGLPLSTIMQTLQTSCLRTAFVSVARCVACAMAGAGATKRPPRCCARGRNAPRSCWRRRSTVSYSRSCLIQSMGST